jgi:hypothetical protein
MWLSEFVYAPLVRRAGIERSGLGLAVRRMSHVWNAPLQAHLFESLVLIALDPSLMP